MVYRIEIYRPGKGDVEDCVKAYTSATPFLPVQTGEFIDVEESEDGECKLLRVAKIEHVISQQSLGIDPSGGTTHRVLIFTEEESRRKEEWQ